MIKEARTRLEAHVSVLDMCRIRTRVGLTWTRTGHGWEVPTFLFLFFLNIGHVWTHNGHSIGSFLRRRRSRIVPLPLWYIYTLKKKLAGVYNFFFLSFSTASRLRTLHLVAGASEKKAESCLLNSMSGDFHTSKDATGRERERTRERADCSISWAETFILHA